MIDPALYSIPFDMQYEISSAAPAATGGLLVYGEEKDKPGAARMVTSLRYYLDCRVFAMVHHVSSRWIAVEIFGSRAALMHVGLQLRVGVCSTQLSPPRGRFSR